MLLQLAAGYPVLAWSSMYSTAQMPSCARDTLSRAARATLYPMSVAFLNAACLFGGDAKGWWAGEGGSAAHEHAQSCWSASMLSRHLLEQEKHCGAHKLTRLVSSLEPNNIS